MAQRVDKLEFLVLVDNSKFTSTAPSFPELVPNVVACAREQR